MLGQIMKWMPLRRRRRRQDLKTLRRHFAESGYDADDIRDSELEAAIDRYCGPIEDPLPLTGRRINWILRSLSADRHSSRARIARARSARRISER